MSLTKAILDRFESELKHQREWLLIKGSVEIFELNSTEIELEQIHDRRLLTFIDEKGSQAWRIVKLREDNAKFQFELTRNFGAEETRVELVPRTRYEVFGGELELARLEKANRIAGILASEIDGIKLVRVELNKENGRFAQILVENAIGRRTAVVADVTHTISPESLVVYSIVWLSKLERLKKKSATRIWILAEDNAATKLTKLAACLSESWKRKISIWRLKITGPQSGVSRLQSPSKRALWNRKPPKLHLGDRMYPSNTARRIIDQSPEKIDYLFSKNGETLRFLGLPFLRVRKVLDDERAWVGIEKEKRPLNPESFEELHQLLRSLEEYRSHDTPNMHHVLYESAPEAWLESMLRRNIKLLDSNLILSPIYNQFRASRDKIDLLAIRKDGRLVIIELKVSTDREMIFQAVDYWRKIEHQRRAGTLDKANLFGHRKIADKPSIVYLVAPTLSYHRDFKLLANTISDSIEIFRFDLAENWREEIKVLGRKRV